MLVSVVIKYLASIMHMNIKFLHAFHQKNVHIKEKKLFFFFTLVILVTVMEASAGSTVSWSRRSTGPSAPASSLTGSLYTQSVCTVFFFAQMYSVYTRVADPYPFIFFMGQICFL